MPQNPFKFACRIPKETFKTVTDAWNKYHGVPLRKIGTFLPFVMTLL